MKPSSVPQILTSIREATSPLHKELESVPPFNALLDKNLSKLQLHQFFTAMCSVFSPLLEDATDSFYVQKRQAMEKWTGKDDLRAPAQDFSLMSLRYVFLGSLMGGGQVIQRNEKVSELGADDYFRTDKSELLQRWQELIADLGAVTDSAQQSSLVAECQTIFRELLKFSQ